MSLATRCPACGTIFRVVQDQLKVSEGWVRCGQCHEVFHGIEALFDLDSDPAIAARRAAPRPPAAPPPTRVFAEQRASAPIPPPPAPSAPVTPVVPPVRPSPPIAIAPRPAPPAPVAGGGFAAPPSPIRPGYTGFTPAAPAMAAPTRSPIPPLATRSTIAPRFAARLAEESARTQAPVAAPEPVFTREDAAAPWSMARPADASPDAAPVVAASAAAASAAAVVDTPVVNAPMVSLVTPLAEPSPSPGPADLAAEFAAPPTPRETPLAAPWAASPASPAPPAAPATSAAPTAEAAASEPAVALATAPDGDTDTDEDEDDAHAGPPTLASMLPEDAGEWPPRRPRARKRPADAPAGSSEVALVDSSRDPRFLREARSGARWRKPWVRAMLGVSLVLLVGAAAGQLAWPMRDTLAARWPVTRPAWDWLCQQAGCRIEPPRAIASLALDGSSLTRTDTEHVLLFSADLHNRSGHEVRVPSFDVTFMDLNGEIVARKVLTPEQIGIHQAALPPDGELHVHARLQVGALPASGFQADLFYP